MKELLNSSGNAGTPTIKYEITEKDLHKVMERLVVDTVNLVVAKWEEDRTPEYLTRKEAMEMLSVKTPATMISWEEKEYLNPHRISGRIFYRKDEVLQAYKNFSRVSNALN